MFDQRHISTIKVEDVYKLLANKTVRVCYVDVGDGKMWGLHDPETNTTYITGGEFYYESETRETQAEEQ